MMGQQGGGFNRRFFFYDPTNHPPTLLSDLHPNNICSINGNNIQTLNFDDDDNKDYYYQHGGRGDGGRLACSSLLSSSSSFSCNPSASTNFHLPQFQLPQYQRKASKDPREGEGEEARQQERSSDVENPLGLDLTCEILCRLPAEDVLRCRAVSKSWLSLTKEAHFIRKHHLMNKPRASDLGIIFLRTCSVLRTPSSLRELSLRYCFNGCREFDIRELLCRETCSHRMSNSCDGLVCVYGERNTYVLNPCIREVLVLPETDNIAASADNATDCSVALGYDISTGEYKVVRLFSRLRRCRRRRRLFRSMDSGSSSSTVGCEIFSLGSLSWRSVGDAPPCTVRNDLLPVVVNGAIHWLSWLSSSSAGAAADKAQQIGILSFDIEGENFGVIAQPMGFQHQDGSGGLGVKELGGYLCMSARSPRCSKQHHIWVLQDYASRRWVKRVVNMEHEQGGFMPRMFREAAAPVTVWDGREVWQGKRPRFHLYDLKSGRFTTTTTPTCEEDGLTEAYREACAYVESLVSPIAIQEEKTKKKKKKKKNHLLHKKSGSAAGHGRRKSRGVCGTKYYVGFF